MLFFFFFPRNFLNVGSKHDGGAHKRVWFWFRFLSINALTTILYLVWPCQQVLLWKAILIGCFRWRMKYIVRAVWRPRTGIAGLVGMDWNALVEVSNQGMHICLILPSAVLNAECISELKPFFSKIPYINFPLLALLTYPLDGWH